MIPVVDIDNLDSPRALEALRLLDAGRVLPVENLSLALVDDGAVEVRAWTQWGQADRLRHAVEARTAVTNYAVLVSMWPELRERVANRRPRFCLMRDCGNGAEKLGTITDDGAFVPSPHYRG